MKKQNNYFILFIIITLTACSGKKEIKDEHEVLPENIVEMNNDQVKMAGIELDSLSHKVLGNTLKVNGIISAPPQNIAAVSFSMGGYIRNIQLIQGSSVAKGQVLATIENAEFIELQQNYIESKNQLEYAESEYNRQKNLYKENVSSAKTYQQSLSDYKSLKVKVNALNQKLALIGIDASTVKEDNISRSVRILSPISGYIKSANVNTGKYVNPSDVLFEIVNNQNLLLELSMFEKDISKVSIGQKVNFTTPDKPENVYQAIVYQVGKAIDDDKTIKVYAKVDGSCSELMTGMYINGGIRTTDFEVEALPDEAIVSFDDKSYIFISKGKRIENNKEINDFLMVEVKKGMSGNGYTEVILPDSFDIVNSKIVIKGTYNLLSAMKNAGDMAC